MNYVEEISLKKDLLGDSLIQYESVRDTESI